MLEGEVYAPSTAPTSTSEPMPRPSPETRLNSLSMMCLPSIRAKDCSRGRSNPGDPTSALPETKMLFR